ncbi:hypothetical protein [Endozoicomonas sp. ONNA1]|uniref:DUF7484 family protein n=1 Tax=Endozoicomonas sp. ONNA1 TaxID=2828740 RepID=UPI0021482908|nr:hypothetical protein [Endozoicomonas sp. ONNA1]
MNVIENAITDLQFIIPMEVLNFAFISTNPWDNYLPTNLGHEIKQKVIRPRVLKDCNLEGGIQAAIALEGLPFVQTPDNKLIIEIPTGRLQGRDITSIHSVSFSNPYTNSHNYNGSMSAGTLTQAAGQLLESAQGLEMVGTGRVRLIETNTILIDGDLWGSQSLWLRCQLSNDAELTHFAPKAFRSFSKLCEHAVKSYLYNQRAIIIDTGQIHAGMTLGRFRDFIDSYSDAEELYQEYLTNVFSKVAFQQDAGAHQRHLRRLTGGRL